MQVTTFSCPHCAATLRIRDRMFVGRTVGCPDCGEQLAIVADGAKGFRAEKVEPSARPPRKRPTRSAKRRKRKPSANTADHKEAPPTPQWVKSLRAKALSPVGIAWITAILCTVVLFAFMMSGSSRDQKETPDNVADGDAGAAPKQTPPPGGADPWSSPADSTRGRMLQLGDVLAQYERAKQHFPAGTVSNGLPPEQSHSWMATLAANSKSYGTVKPNWDRPWSAPVNERFRTQSIALFRNPRLPETPGRDRLPVAHFVGVAGVGVDGPNLPVDHPRAGIFGYNRVTRREDIKDGLGNTMMIAGVHGRLAGWSTGGPGTIRPFTKTPYIDGPDGFSTGHGNRMLVLMADGSVREISRNTAPVVVRRMAAMADGFPLDPNKPGDPALLKPSTPIKPPPVAGKKPPVKAKRKPTPKLADAPVRAKRPRPRPDVVEPKPVDVAAALAQPILRFEQTTAQPLGILIDELEEIAGVPIRYDKLALAKTLERRASFKLENTTVKAILQALVTEAGLTYRTEADGLRIVAAGEKGVQKK